MKINDFQNEINEKILLRGKKLFKDEKVKELHQNENDWSAVVSGSIDYQVHISIENDNITEHNCSCPYDQGPICKHQVAVLYAIKEKLHSKEEPKKTGQQRKIKSRPIPLKERHTILFLEKGRIDVIDGSFVIIDKNGIRTHIPVGGITTLMLEPGTRISHAAIAVAAEVGCLILWVGEGGVRLYSAGQPGGARADKLLYQAKLALDDELRLKVTKAMYQFRFKEKAPERRSIEQLRGIEGSRVRALYKLFAKQFGVEWKGRSYDPKDWSKGDIVNRCLSAANHCLYGICEAAILAAGYAPAIGFIHTGKPRSFVYDIADLFKFDTVVPVAFRAAKENKSFSISLTRKRCRDMFRETKILKTIIPTIESILAAGEIEPPDKRGTVPVAIIDEKGIADAGHRN